MEFKMPDGSDMTIEQVYNTAACHGFAICLAGNMGFGPLLQKIVAADFAAWFIEQDEPLPLMEAWERFGTETMFKMEMDQILGPDGAE